jgi:hypothetical protein
MTGTRAPITKQRSEWRDITDMAANAIAVTEASGATDVQVFVRLVGDGLLHAIRSVDAGKLHLSVSWAPQSERQARRGSVRYPTWDELADARDVLLPDHLAFGMILPKRAEYVAVHPTTFHLHEMADA